LETYIIGEIGINHNGDIEIAKRLIDMAIQCGCNAVKFQKRTVDIVYTSDYLKSLRRSPWGMTQREQKEGLEFGKKQYDEIDCYCKERFIDWSASAWDLESQKFLQEYDVPFNKIASAMLTYFPLLELIASEGKPTFISTGMSNYEQIDEAVRIFQNNKCPFTLMHCVSTYPCPDEDCNIRMIPTLRDKYKCPVGYSGHEIGILPSVLAVSLGAEVIERHITLDRSMYGSDQSASLEKRGLELLVRDIRCVQSVFGDGQKRKIPSEEKTERSLRYFREY